MQTPLIIKEVEEEEEKVDVEPLLITL